MHRQWTSPSAETMSVSDGTEFRITRFANLEMKLALVEAGRAVEFLGVRGIGYLVKGVAEAELQKFAQEGHWLMLYSEPAAAIVWRTIRIDPCKASGTYDIDMVPWTGGASQAPNHKLLRAKGHAVADGQGLIRYSIRFDTEPALPPDRPLSYAGTLSFVTQGDGNARRYRCGRLQRHARGQVGLRRGAGHDVVAASRLARQVTAIPFVLCLAPAALTGGASRSPIAHSTAHLARPRKPQRGRTVNRRL
jgi:hypothetical protein